MVFEQVSTSGDRNFGYFIADELEGVAAVIDPSGCKEKFLDLLERHNFRLKYVICTHDHYDHTSGAVELARRGKALLAMHSSAGSPVDLAVEDGDLLRLGALTLRIIHTPGHTRDSICVLCENILLTGDTLFVGKVGGTDLGAGARAEYESIHGKILALPDSVKVFPGHDYGVSPSSTIGLEKKSNPFILCPGFEEFVDLKANWAEYKRKHGIK